MKKILMLVLLTMSMGVLAGGDPHHEPIENTDVTYMIEDKSHIAAALGGHQFDYGNYREQKSVSVAVIDGKAAASAAFAYRGCRDCGLFSGAAAVGRVEGKTKIGVVTAYTWSY